LVRIWWGFFLGPLYKFLVTTLVWVIGSSWCFGFSSFFFSWFGTGLSIGGALFYFFLFPFQPKTQTKNLFPRGSRPPVPHQFAPCWGPHNPPPFPVIFQKFPCFFSLCQGNGCRPKKNPNLPQPTCGFFKLQIWTILVGFFGGILGFGFLCVPLFRWGGGFANFFFFPPGFFFF